jgi:multidrug efflux system membrane fusion protein
MYTVRGISHKTGAALYFIIFMIILGTALLPACSKGKEKQQRKKPAAPVSVSAVTQQTVPVQIEAIGNVEAYSTVAIKAQINGQLMRVHFREGQDVKRGDLLFTIDPRPFQVQIKQAEANLARSTAQMENARADATRYEALVKKGYVAKEQYEQFRTNALALDATVSADRALLDNAKLQLAYCYIHTPVTGRTGSLAVNEGNLIKANADSAMVVINQIQPIYVNFSVPEKNLQDIKSRLKSGKLAVEAFVSKDNSRPFHGVLTFVDNTVDPATGTIRLKATFDNRERALWPGQFVAIRITLTTIQSAVVVPSQAVQTGQQGQFVFVIKDDTAELRPITAGITYNDMTVIEKGLAPEEQVVTDGQMRLMPGAKVEIRKPGQGAAPTPAKTGMKNKDAEAAGPKPAPAK